MAPKLSENDRLIPTIEGVADYFGVVRRTIKRWNPPLIPTGINRKGNYVSALEAWRAEFFGKSTNAKADL